VVGVVEGTVSSTCDGSGHGERGYDEAGERGDCRQDGLNLIVDWSASH
jgi:hypothetical protein